MASKNDETPKRFRTHANYLRAFSLLIPSATGGRDLEPLRARFKDTPAMTGACVDPTAVFKSLQMAWRTELLIDFTSAAFEDDELVRVANSWAVVQVYYILYHATQAFAQARGQSRTPNHPQTQNIFKSHWSDRAIDLPPWSLSRDRSTVRNGSKEIQIEDVHAWVTCSESTKWSLAAKALRTTRDDAVAKAMDAKRQQLLTERKKQRNQHETTRLKTGQKVRAKPLIALPRLSEAEKSSIDARVRAYTMMDYLYRLRIRTNYEDSAIFTDGPVDDNESLQVRRSLRRISSSTLMIHELAVADLLGPATVVSQARSFLKASVPERSETALARRLHLIDAHRG